MRIDIPSLGFGGAPLGNMFREVGDADARATLEAAWDAGIRLYDTSPHYGAGLSERRFAEVLADKPRDDFVLCSKVGRLLEPADQPENAPPFVNELPFKRVLDYSADGARRSIEASLERLRTDRLDLVWIHDLSEDQHGPAWRDHFAQAMQGAAKALTEMREEGLILGWGLGVNLVEPCRLALEQSDPDAFLLAGRYSLLDHREALDTLFPECERRGVGIVAGGPYNSGLLAGGKHYNYAEAEPALRRKVELIEGVCQDHGVDIRAAALQFCLAHPTVAATIPGSSTAERARQNAELLRAPIPAAFWRNLREIGVLPEDAPTPA
ncbi:aldo/keto reductase [Pseudomonas sp. AS2.8]|uniref:aldo/keto reductase n=1 Tax=Pseudomonas sp. AS2.8 TaxID=2587128 RepID=UPI0016182E1B|nr:aldo/keto reductase [Pseudomonas sp. AS2.8]MBB2897153.1 D-threo-aldose 1-dehydrogenase [Pseudomonas sp. AS2.8]